jgi:hypothetical protein
MDIDQMDKARKVLADHTPDLPSFLKYLEAAIARCQSEQPLQVREEKHGTVTTTYDSVTPWQQYYSLFYGRAGELWQPCMTPLPHMDENPYSGLIALKLWCKENLTAGVKAELEELGGKAKDECRKPYTFGPSYRSVNWYGQPYSFGPTEAQIVEILAAAYEDGTPDVDAGALLGLSNDERKTKGKKESHAHRVRDIFRMNPAWGTMIQPGKGRGKRGTYHLQPPADAS